MAIYTIEVNNQKHQVEVSPGTPLLWVLRDTLGLTGTKYGCGIGQCGACTVHLDGTAVRSCSIPVQATTGVAITTIEGLSEQGEHPVQAAWQEADVPQCGYCQAGQIMAASSLLNQNPNPTDQEIVQVMSGNICRCGTYVRIKKAVKLAAEKMS